MPLIARHPRSLPPKLVLYSLSVFSTLMFSCCKPVPDTDCNRTIGLDAAWMGRWMSLTTPIDDAASATVHLWVRK